MIRGQNIICVSSIDWDFVWQGHQEIMSAFARAGNRVLYIENTGIRTPSLKDIPRLKKRLVNWKKGVSGIRKEGENLYVYSPLVLPFPYSGIIKPINRLLFVHNITRWMSMADFANPIIWTFLPTNITIDLIDNIDNKKLIVYYCIAEFSQLVKSSKKVEKTEKELLKRCDVVFAQGQKIKERCLKHNKNVHIFPFGVNDKVFLNYNTEAPKAPQDIEPIPRPILGYIGGIHKHVDADLLKDVARKRPDWSIELVGPMQIDKDTFKDCGNIHLRGKKELNELPFWIQRFDVCTIPYLLNEYTKTVYPTKLNEYLSMGKPVISTALPEVEAFNNKHGGVVEIVDNNTDSFIKAIEKTLKSPSDQKIRDRRRAIARESNWSSRIEKMTGLMEEAMERRHKEKALRWREEMILFYKRLRGKVLKASLAIILLFILVFETPMLWFVASPLKISQPPQKADAIVVFGGGVGEAGSPGKSTIERARYSVDLYNEGFSKCVIYSSGYTYKYNDAENMKLFAMSMGVPERDIVLEQKAGSCYENVKYTSQILKEKGFRKILLVSSPYNMRRASLVFGHIAKGIDVIYTPVPKPHFYHRVRHTKLEQIRGIMHEYLGIVYYFFKGYI